MNLQGIWYNELGSVLTIDAIVGNTFQLNYQTAVSTENCAQGTFNGTGYINVAPSGTTIGMVVAWQNELSNCESVTTWSGYCTVDPLNQQIVAFWLLTSIDPANQWASTLVGQDIFSQTPPTEKEIEKNSLIKRHSHK